MKKVFLFILTAVVVFACGKNNDPEAQKTTVELITQNGWTLEKMTDKDGKVLTNSAADLLFKMTFEFRSNGEARAYEKANKLIVDRGTWALTDNETAVDVDIKSLKTPIKFKIMAITSSKLTLQAPTGNFLTGVGEAINLEFSVTK